MKNRIVALVASLALGGAAGLAGAQDLEPTFYSRKQTEKALNAPHPPGGQRCTGPIKMVTDVGFEGVRTTGWNFGMMGGGGEGGRFDPNPLLSTVVTLNQGGCLNAHFSALVGSRQTYGPAFSALTLFQVTLSPVNGGLQHLYGHYETPYGVYAPAVAIEAERDVDTYGSNFFQRVGTGHGEVPPGTYRVHVWWAGGPIGGGGAIGAAFVLKLYHY
jgi:hypothetical protein